VDDDANVANFTETETIMRVVVSVRLALGYFLGTKWLIEGEERRISSPMFKYEVQVRCAEAVAVLFADSFL
jgi:hypothetical protein